MARRSAEVIRTLHQTAETEMKAQGPTGEAWLYVFEKTSDEKKNTCLGRDSDKSRRERSSRIANTKDCL